MDAYTYRAGLLCADCAMDTRLRIEGRERVSVAMLESSDHYPQGPYAGGGGEADCPQHCDHCSKFLENPLTDDGREYVQDAVDDGRGPCIAEWARFYGIKREVELPDDPRILESMGIYPHDDTPSIPDHFER